MWVVSPFMYLAALIMFVMTAFSYNVNITLFIVELSISVVFTIALIFARAQFWIHTRLAIKSARAVLLTENEEALNNMTLPIVVTGLEGDVMWANDIFVSEIAEGENVIADNITKYLYPKTLRQVLNEKNANIQYKNKKFTVYSIKTLHSHILYFVDDTYFKDIFKEYTEKKPVVALICFDDKDQVVRESGGGEESRITSEVEAVLREWATEMAGFLRKLSSSNYLMMTDEIHVEQAIANKFAVLDKVRQIRGDGNLYATISVGIGRNAPSAVDSETWARRALDMALGRGGDQVVIIKKGELFDFFGGVSRSVEKRDKVRSRVIATTLTEHIKKSDKVLIMGHKNSDLDSMGSAIGVWAAAQKGLNKQSYIVVDKNTSLAMPLIDEMMQAYPDRRIFIEPYEALQEVSEKSLIVVVDTHSNTFTESTELLKKAKKIVIIDHHRMLVNYIRESLIFYHEPSASSASEMVTELVQYIDMYCLDVVEAQALLSGIILDTKYFVFKAGVRTFEASAYLKQRGADTIKVKKYFANSMNSYREKAQLVSRADIYNGCAVACGEEDEYISRVAAAQAADELLSIQGVKASFVLFESNNEIVISGRSLGEVNVQVILEEFGGGGHLTMAGAQMKGTNINDAKAALIAVLADKV